MLYRSTELRSPKVGFLEALMNGLAPDGGLYMPESLPPEITGIASYDFPDDAAAILDGFVPEENLLNICHEVFSFPVPLKKIADNLFVLELFHGPTLSFKDFGARFMAREMAAANRSSGKVLNIIVATSGDTGSAVASAFHNVPGIKVFILYPSGRVTDLQEKQMATLGGNVSALEVAGDFDDCQRIAKEILNDPKLRRNFLLSSANSINIGRLLPQMTYYFWAHKLLQQEHHVLRRPIFVVPSGNFGNLTAGLFARKMGLPSELFVAAVNSNSAVPEYLATGNLSEKKTAPTLSNAMDVGNPSNWARIMDLYEYDRAKLQTVLRVVSVTDKETRQTIFRTHDRYGYVADPHTAVGLRAAEKLKQQGFAKTPIIVLSTAHPAKFRETVEDILRVSVEIPQRLAEVANKDKQSIPVEPSKEAVVKIIKTAR